MKSERLCFTCAFWKDKVGNPTKYRQIINGEHYTFNPWLEEKNKALTGFGGREFYILLNTGEVIRSNNVWYQGEIPPRFRKQLPDTAKFITKQAYRKIKNQPHFKCKSKGCWDRYHCYWYDKQLEVGGAWNVVPKSHKIGDECCEIFLDKDKMYL